MARRVLAVAVLLANVMGCSGSGSGEAVAKTCSDACGAIFACAAQLGYDLTQNGITPSGCVADCSGGECGGAVNDCIAALACPATIDLYGIALRQCGDANACTIGLPVPIGACDMVASTGECVEHLGNVDPDYSQFTARCRREGRGSPRARSRVAPRPVSSSWTPTGAGAARSTTRLTRATWRRPRPPATGTRTAASGIRTEIEGGIGGVVPPTPPRGGSIEKLKEPTIARGRTKTGAAL